MADEKLSGLTAITGASVDSAADFMYLVDSSGAVSRKILVDEVTTAQGFTPTTGANDDMLVKAAGVWGPMTPVSVRAVLALDRVQITGIIKGTLAAESIKILLSSVNPFDIDTATFKLGTGTCTVTVRTDLVNITGLGALTLTTTESTDTGTAGLSVATGQDIDINISTITSAEDLEFNIKGTRT